jgi:polyphosphate kinase
LRPGIEGISDKIRVHTVIDRFLEHARITHFRNGGADEVFCSSADWMPRNFRRRVEVMFPVLDDQLKQRMIEEILGTMRADTAKGWLLQPSGHYQRLPDREAGVRSQQRFMELARERAREQEPIRGLTSKPLTVPPPPLERLRRRAEKKRKKRRRDE